MLTVSRTLLSAVLATTVAPVSHTEQVEHHYFDFIYELELRVPTGKGPIDIFVPLAQTDAQQTVEATTIEATVSGVERTDTTYGNKFWHGHIERSNGELVKFSARHRVRRRAVDVDLFLSDDPASPSVVDYSAEELAANALYLQPNRRVPVSGEIIDDIVKHIAPGETSPLKVARAIYDYVIDELEYKRIGSGWGQGDTHWACSAKYGNCTDFHALFISLARAKRIPARFEIGFPVYSDLNHASVGAYHCWVQLFLPALGWIPIDAADANNQPDKRDQFFGKQPPDRIKLSVGRDLWLGQRQPPINYFVFPHVEVDGELFTELKTHLHYRSLAPDGQELPDTGEPTLEEVARAIEKFVAEDAKLKGGYFMVYDPKARQPLLLTLDKVHRRRLSKVAEGVYFICADFTAPTGKVYDLDFWMRGSTKDTLVIADAVAVHKEDGMARYFWSYDSKSHVWKQIHGIDP